MTGRTETAGVAGPDLAGHAASDRVADPTSAASTPIDGLPFDAALAELERTVALLESGGAPLEETIALYERAVALERQCTKLLADARLRMEHLVERAGGGLEATEVRAADPGMES